MQRKYEKYDKHQERASSYRNHSHLENEYDDYYEGNLYEPQDLRQRIEENRRSKQSSRSTHSGSRETTGASNYHHTQPYQRYGTKYQSPDDRNYEKYEQQHHHSRHSSSRHRDEKGVDRHKESTSSSGSKETHVKSERIVVKDNEVKRSKIEAEVFEVVSDEEGELKSDGDNKSESGRNNDNETADDKTPKDNYHDVSPVSSKEFTPNSSKRSTSASKSDADDADGSSKKSKSSENVSGDERSNDSKKSEKSDGGNKGGKKRRSSSSSSSSNDDDSVKKKKPIDYKKVSDKMEGYMEYEQEIYEEEESEGEETAREKEQVKSDQESMSEEEEEEEKDQDEKEREENKEENKVENDQKEQQEKEEKLAPESIDDIDKMDEEPLYNCAIYGCRSVEEYECLNKIEEGSYGVVFRAKDKKTNEIVALKRLKMEKEREGFPITSLREVDTLLKAQHPNIVTVREIVVGSNMDKIYMVMDYVEHDLKSLMQYSMKKPFKINEVKTLMQQLLRGVAHLHDNWIIHRDLKTSNLLLSHSGVLKIADFGLAREYGSPLKEYTPIVVTLWYRSVELLLGVKKYSTAVDMWSVGAIFGELLLMKALFQGKGEMDQLNKIFKDLGTPNEKIWPKFKEMPLARSLNFPNFPYNTLRSRFNKFSITDLGFDLLMKLLTYDPERRINADNALKHEYFRETPLPIETQLFPTWPAKSEGMVKKHVSDNEPKAPSAGKKYEELISEDAFVLQQPITAGFQLK